VCPLAVLLHNSAIIEGSKSELRKGQRVLGRYELLPVTVIDGDRPRPGNYFLFRDTVTRLDWCT
jgi:hypothetical protein